MDNEEMIPENDREMEILEREDRCRKALKTLNRAIFMRLFVTGILGWAAWRDKMELWVIGLLVLVMIINLTGLLPLVTEWKKRRKELKEILAEDV